MLSKLRPRSIFDVMAAITFFVVLGSGVAYAANTVRTTDIVDNEVFTTDVRDDTLGYGGLTHPDIGPGAVRSSEVLNDSLTRFDIGNGEVDSYNIRDEHVATAEVQNGALKDEDIAQVGGTVTNFLGDIGLVPARSCVSRRISGIDASGDHLLLEPNFDGSSPNLSYGVEYSTSQNGDAFIKVCNPTNGDINDSFTRFNLLEINAN